MNLQQQISGRLFFGHLRVIVVSEEYARKGLQNLNDYFRRNPEVRRMAWLLISDGKAVNLMKAAPELERVPALYLLSTLDNAVRSGKFPTNYVGMFWSNSVKKGQEAYLPYVELKKQQNIELKGLAYFKNEEMVGATKPLEIASYMQIKGLNPAGYRAFVQLEGTPHTVTIYSTSRKSKFNIQIRNNHLYFKVLIFIEINMEEKINEQFTINNSQILKEIEKVHMASTKKAAEVLIKEMQLKKTDIFGFGEYVRAKKPSYWNREIKTKEKWQEMFQNINVEIKVTSKIRRVGMKAK
jgi:spore germination protein KC